MKIKILIVFTLACLSFLGCEKQDNPEVNLQEDEFIIFGHFFGFCHGEECIEVFKIEDGKLFEDTNDNYPLIDAENPYQGNYIELSQTLYEQVANLKDFFPEELLNETDVILGLPDASDGGGYYVAVKENGVIKHWRIDRFKNRVPAFLHAFTDKMEEAISTIND